MKFSYDWLADFVDLSGITPVELAEKLTYHAFEVEEVSTYGAKIVGPITAGKIISIEPHPNADKIRLTRVLINDTDTYDIVCGASNIEVDQIVPVALPGSIVINRHDNSPLPIKKSKIRGADSNGMLCSASELGISTDNSNNGGIYILKDSNIKLGTDLIDLLNLKQDYILHIEPRSNRPDVLSHYGMAREIAAIFNLPLKEPKTNINEFSQFQEAFIDLDINIENKEDCPFFSLCGIKNLTDINTPSLIRHRLEAIGVRSINFIVDITNYVLHEMGQPMHAYDYDKLDNSRAFLVRRACNEETITTIDNRLRKLNSTNLVIANNQKAIGVAGIMGGIESEISNSTQNVILESACFDARSVRQSSRSLGLSSDSSLRFERGVIKHMTLNSLNRALYLILNYSIASNPNIKYSKVFQTGDLNEQTNRVSLSFKDLDNTLGVSIDTATVESILNKLGFSVIDKNQFEISVQIPLHRLKDIGESIDLVEEIARLYGYNNIPLEPLETIDHIPHNQNISDKVKENMVGFGFNEIWTSSLIPKKRSRNTDIQVLNPVSQDHEYLRSSLIPGLIQAFEYNLARQHKDIFLFENAYVYKHDSSITSTTLDLKSTGVSQILSLAALCFGSNERQNWLNLSQETTELSFFRLKGILENILVNLNINLNLISWDSCDNEYLHPTRQASIIYNDPSRKIKLGHIGEIHPKLAIDYNTKQRLSLFEIDLDAVQGLIFKDSFKSIANTPFVNRDITIDCDTIISHQSIKWAIISQNYDKLTNLELVGLYRPSDNIKSLTYRLSFQDTSKTLLAQEIDEIIEKIRLNLIEKFNVSFRGL